MSRGDTGGGGGGVTVSHAAASTRAFVRNKSTGWMDGGGDFLIFYLFIKRGEERFT